jgi:hypothetical protein
VDGSHSTTAARLRVEPVRDAGGRSAITLEGSVQERTPIIQSTKAPKHQSTKAPNHLGEAEVGDHAASVEHEDVEALQVPVRHLLSQVGLGLNSEG